MIYEARIPVTNAQYEQYCIDHSTFLAEDYFKTEHPNATYTYVELHYVGVFDAFQHLFDIKIEYTE